MQCQVDMGQTSVTSPSTDALSEESGSFMQPSWSMGLAVDHECLPVAEQLADRQVGRGSAGVSQGFKNGVTGMSQGCRKGVTGVSQGCHMGCRRDVAGMSQGCRRSVTGVSQECHRGVA